MKILHIKYLLVSKILSLLLTQTAGTALNPQHHLCDQHLGAELLLKTDKARSLKEHCLLLSPSFLPEL